MLRHIPAIRRHDIEGDTYAEECWPGAVRTMVTPVYIHNIGIVLNGLLYKLSWCNSFYHYTGEVVYY